MQSQCYDISCRLIASKRKDCCHGDIRNLRGDDSFKCLWRDQWKIGNRPVVTKLVGVKSIFLDKRTDNIYWLLKSEGKKPFSRGKFIIVVMVGRRTSMQFFRSHVRSFFFSEVFNSAKLLLDLFIPGTLKYLLLKSFKLVD